MMLAAIVFGYKNLSSKSIIYQIPTYFFFVSLSLAASSDVAGSNTFLIPKIIQKQYHLISPAQIHSY
jgi:hypothetical protein